MHLPSITSTYLALLALLYTVLAVQVGRLRQRDRATFGDNGSLQLRSAIRAHANFIEYVPIITLMVAMLEMSGLAAIWVHLLMGALLVCRCCTRSACMPDPTRCNFASAGSAASRSRWFYYWPAP